jgi:hypothetical protein
VIITIIDGNGAPQRAIIQAQGPATDRSGAITGPVAGNPQVLMVANPNRSGWWFENVDAAPMTLSDFGGDPTLASAVVVYPGQSFPPPGYPVPVTAITIAGTLGQKFVAREW